MDDRLVYVFWTEKRKRTPSNHPATDISPKKSEPSPEHRSPCPHSNTPRTTHQSKKSSSPNGSLSLTNIFTDSDFLMCWSFLALLLLLLLLPPAEYFPCRL